MFPFEIRQAEVSDPGCPPSLRRAMADARLGPRFEFVGELALAGRSPRVAMIGTREPAAESLAAMEALAAQLASSGAVVISGAAIGTDMASHCGALHAGGPTVAVLPRGLGSVDWATWRRDFADLPESAPLLLISPFSRRQEMTRQTPMIRNRLVAALAQAVVVGEAGPMSGTLGCLGFALEFSVPAFRLASGEAIELANPISGRLPRPFAADEAYGESLVRRILDSCERFEVDRIAAAESQLRLFGDGDE